MNERGDTAEVSSGFAEAVITDQNAAGDAENNLEHGGLASNFKSVAEPEAEIASSQESKVEGEKQSGSGQLEEVLSVADQLVESAAHKDSQKPIEGDDTHQSFAERPRGLVGLFGQTGAKVENQI